MKGFHYSYMKSFILLMVMIFMITACSNGNLPQPTHTPPSPVVHVEVLPSEPSVTPVNTSTSTPIPTATATVPPTPAVTATPDPYQGLTIPDLSARDYGGGEITVEKKLQDLETFTREQISYPSDGLKIYGFINVPKKPGSYPVVILVHGYVDPSGYLYTTPYMIRYADALSQAGFIVIYPNLRGYPPSEDGKNSFEVGYAIDVLNLIAMVRENAGKPGPLKSANGWHIGILGHSMGGGIALRVLTVDQHIQAAVLYSSMSPDEKLNYERMYYVLSNGKFGKEELQTSDEDFMRISPVNFLYQIQAAVSIHQGLLDPDVPPEWSADLCNQLRSLGKTSECYTYPGEGHIFSGDADALLMKRMVNFFQYTLK
jgi:uncharacterized protein